MDRVVTKVEEPCVAGRTVSLGSEFRPGHFGCAFKCRTTVRDCDTLQRAPPNDCRPRAKKRRLPALCGGFPSRYTDVRTSSNSSALTDRSRPTSGPKSTSNQTSPGLMVATYRATTVPRASRGRFCSSRSVDAGRNRTRSPISTPSICFLLDHWRANSPPRVQGFRARKGGRPFGNLELSHWHRLQHSVRPEINVDEQATRPRGRHVAGDDHSFGLARQLPCERKPRCGPKSNCRSDIYPFHFAP
jgi:hypothetical protein